MLQCVIDAVRGAGYAPWLALGAHRHEIEAHEGLDLSACRLVSVEDWEQGMSASLKAGIAEIREKVPEASGVLVLLADQPAIRTQTILKICSVIEAAPDRIQAAAYRAGKGEGSAGVPAYFPKSQFAALLNLSGAQGARQLIRSQPHDLLDLGWVTEDVDVPEDLERLAALTAVQSRP